MPKQPAVPGKCQCRFCPQTFTRKHDAERHVKATHMKLKPFQCDYCGKPFSNKENTTRHAKSCKAAPMFPALPTAIVTRKSVQAPGSSLYSTAHWAASPVMEVAGPRQPQFEPLAPLPTSWTVPSQQSQGYLAPTTPAMSDYSFFGSTPSTGLSFDDSLADMQSWGPALFPPAPQIPWDKFAAAATAPTPSFAPQRGGVPSQPAAGMNSCWDSSFTSSASATPSADEITNWFIENYIQEPQALSA